MRLRPTGLRSGAFIALLAMSALLAAPAAQAFTFVDPSGSGKDGGVPQFNIEEHTRQFRSGDPAASPGAAIREFQTPWGKGQVQFGVQNGPVFGSPFGSSSFRAQEDRRHMDRMLSAPGLQHQYER